MESKGPNDTLYKNTGRITMKRICQTCKKEYEGEPIGSYGYPYKCDECKAKHENGRQQE